MTKRKRKGRKVKLRPRFFIVLLVLVVIVGFGGYKAYNHMIAERMAAQQAKTQYEQGVKISLAAKAYINLGLKYSDQYYKGGYPPTHVGVCTDVLWRGLKAINVDFRDVINEDIDDNYKDYDDLISYKDRDLDFRVVGVVRRYMERHAESLTTNPSNLLAWQPGDIVIYGNHHLAVVSCLRNLLGYPYIIQHGKDPAGDEDRLINDSGLVVTDHFRWSQTIIM